MALVVAGSNPVTHPLIFIIIWELISCKKVRKLSIRSLLNIFLILKRCFSTLTPMKRNKTLKVLWLIMNVVLLIGLAHCIIIEPALALQHEDTCADEQTHCCFICNSSQHQWNVLDSAVLAQPPQSVTLLVSNEFQYYSHSSVDAVFHPPTVPLRI